MATSFYFLKTFCSTMDQGVTNVLRQILLFAQINHSDNLCVNELANMNIALKMKFPIKDFFSKCDQIRRKLGIWSHLPKKSSMKNFIFCAVEIQPQYRKIPPIRIILLYFFSLERRKIYYCENIEYAYNFYEADFCVNI